MRARNPSPALALAALAAALAAGAPARAEDPPPGSGGALRVVADPPRVLLGRDAGVELRVTAPPDVEDLELTSSAGAIEGLRRLPGGGFAARLRAPAERVPQVAIVAAAGRGPRGLDDGWVAVPMSALVDARVRAAPGADVALRIGERAFGPVHAGADGTATLGLVVPPGVREAHQGFRPLDLRVPERPLVHAVVERARIHADREERLRVVAYVVAPHGAARRGETPVFEPTRGTVSFGEREAGAFDGTWTIPPGPAGEERLVIRLPSSPASRAVLRVEAVAGAPAVVAVSFDRDALVAGGGDATVTARALDAGGNVVPASLVLSSHGGDLGPAAPGGPGEVVARLSAGHQLHGREAVVTATATGLGISGSRVIGLRPGAPAVATFDGRDGVLRSDGAREAVLRLAVADRWGNPVEAVPTVAATRGRIVAVTARGPGEFDVRYVGPAVAAPAPERIVAEVGPIRAAADRLLVPAVQRYALVAGLGGGVEGRGRFAVMAGTLAAERAADAAWALRRGGDLAWRLEVQGLTRDRGDPLAAVLAGASVRTPARGGVELLVAASAGALLAPGGSAPAVRAAAALGAPRGFMTPFAEVALLAAGRGAPGAFVAATLSAGIRFGLEAPHGEDPHR